jgi:zinc protease
MPTPIIPRYRLERHILSNGLRVVLQPDSTLPLVAVNLWYHVGSKDERPGKTGLAHLFEHMLFQGSEHVGKNDHFRYVQQVGGVANGSTWFDRTNYYETLPAHCLDLGLWLESDRMGFLLPALDQDKLDNQREVVMNERRQTVDNQPYGRAFERLHELLYPPEHPYHWPVIGYMDDIAAATLEDVEDFYRRFYAPDNAVLTLVGDFSCDEAIGRIETYFGSLPPSNGPKGPTPELPAPGSERSDSLEDDVELPRLYVAFTTPPYGSREWYAADLLASIMSGGKTSPLYEDLVYRREIAQDVSTFVLPTGLAASFVLIATGKPETRLEELAAGFDHHLTEAAEGRFRAEDLERARNKLVTNYCNELQALDDRADLISLCTTYFDDPERVSTEIDHYLDVSRSDLGDFAAHFAVPERRVQLQVIPKGSVA